MVSAVVPVGLPFVAHTVYTRPFTVLLLAVVLASLPFVAQVLYQVMPSRIWHPARTVMRLLIRCIASAVAMLFARRLAPAARRIVRRVV